MAELQLISSDSHVSEPSDLWVERLDTKYRDRVPRVVLNPEGQEGAYFVYEGYPPHNLAIGLGAGKTPEEFRYHFGYLAGRGRAPWLPPAPAAVTGS